MILCDDMCCLLLHPVMEDLLSIEVQTHSSSHCAWEVICKKNHTLAPIPGSSQSSKCMDYSASGQHIGHGPHSHIWLGSSRNLQWK